jgi:hypothetical protein
MPRRLRPIQAYSEPTSNRYIHQASGFFHRTSLMEAATDLMTGEAPCEGARKDPDAQAAGAWMMARHAHSPGTPAAAIGLPSPMSVNAAHTTRRPSENKNYAIRINPWGRKLNAMLEMPV